MRWRKTFGLDPIDFVIFWGVAMGLGAGLVDLSREDGFFPLVIGAAAILYAFVRRRALKQLGDEPGPGSDSLAELRDDQAAATEYFERRIAELEERLDFTERMLARQQSPDQIGS